MDPLKTIGTILAGPEPRDAVHIAMMSAVASEEIRPGDGVAIVPYSGGLICECHKAAEACIGVADPFIVRHVREGQRCWVFLRPGTVAGMRHEWTSSLVDPGPPNGSEPQLPRSPAETWLREFAREWGWDYGVMLHEALVIADPNSDPAADAWETPAGLLVSMGRDLHSPGELGPGVADLFWQHVGTVLGREFSADHRRRFTWSCSC